MKSCQRIFGGAHSRSVATAILLVLVVVQLLALAMPTAYAAGGGQLPTNQDLNEIGTGERSATINPANGPFYYRVKADPNADLTPVEDGGWYFYPQFFDTSTNVNKRYCGDDKYSVIGTLTLHSAAGGLGAAVFSIACTAQGIHPTMSIAAVGIQVFSISNMGNGSYSIANLGTSVYESFAVIGLLLVILYFIIDVLDEMQADHFTVDHLIKKLITMAVAILVISQGPTIFRTIIDFGEALMYDVHGAFREFALNNNSELQKTYENMMYTDGVFGFLESMADALGLLFDNIVAYILSYVALLFAYLTAFSRFLEIIIRFAMAPIGLAPLVSGGAKGSGMRYLKKFASVCLQGAVCVAALASATILSSMLTGLSAVIGQVLIPLTLIGFMSKTQGIADDIVGV